MQFERLSKDNEKRFLSIVKNNSLNSGDMVDEMFSILQVVYDDGEWDSYTFLFEVKKMDYKESEFDFCREYEDSYDEEMDDLVEDVIDDTMESISKEMIDEYVEIMRQNYDKKTQKRPKNLSSVFFDEEDLKALENTDVIDEDLKVLKAKIKDVVFDILKSNEVYIDKEGTKLTRENAKELLEGLKEFEKSNTKEFSKIAYILCHLYVDDGFDFDIEDFDMDDFGMNDDDCEDNDFEDDDFEGEEAFDYDFDELEAELDELELEEKISFLSTCDEVFFDRMMDFWLGKDYDFLFVGVDILERQSLFETLIQRELDKMFSVSECIDMAVEV
jgi:hypothetical protein